MQCVRPEKPKNFSFRFPAEWEEHDSTWSSWPAVDAMWNGNLNHVRAEFAHFLEIVGRFEPVHLLVRDEESEHDARKRIKSANIKFHRIPLNDIWLRDNGPMFVTNQNEVSFVNWRFNAWGEKFDWNLDNEVPRWMGSYLGVRHFEADYVMEGGSLELNGKGLCLTTRHCLRSPKRNPQLNEKEIEEKLHEYLGVDKVVWLDNGLEGDHTDSHIDTITRFTNESTILTVLEENSLDYNFSVTQENFRKLKSELPKFDVRPLILPKNKLFVEDHRLPATYANFYIGNGFVAVPVYNDPHDDVALKQIESCFPKHQVFPVMARFLIEGGGAFHCATQQQPKGLLWR